MLLADLGSAFLLASLVMAGFGGVAGVVAGRRGDLALGAAGRSALFGTTAVLVGASATLLAALLSHDFTVAFVFEHSDRSLSPALTAAAFYGGQEGSLLYWGVLLSPIGVG